MNLIELLRLMVDFGLVVLIWMVQLIIYPGFRHYQEARLLYWHPKYTSLITFVVAPLMLGQLFLHSLQLFENNNWYTLISFVLVLFTWILTLTQAVPLHKNLTDGTHIPESTEKLIRTNWNRTALWTLIFLCGVYKSIILNSDLIYF
ncbi:hypothetical protein [Ascidiimonas sp. W6]|uniref:hypothetical protein n=1 Tax=Ascidiimonas meishanensis TaxID=3128903 RepID=UPI0030EEA817